MDGSEKQKKPHFHSAADELIDVIQKLSEEQQKYLLDMIARWTADNREYPRVDCELDAIYSDNNQLAHGLAKNISATGVLIDPSGPFPIGQSIIISMGHPTGDGQIKIKGKVVRRDESGVAIQFDQPVKGIL